MEEYCSYCHNDYCDGECVSRRQKYYEDLEDERNYYCTSGTHDIKCQCMYCTLPPEFWAPVDDD